MDVHPESPSGLPYHTAHPFHTPDALERVLGTDGMYPGPILMDRDAMFGSASDYHVTRACKGSLAPPCWGTDHKLIDWCGGDRCRSSRKRQTHRLDCNVQRPSVRMLHFVFRTARSSARRQGGSTHLDATQAKWSLARTGGAGPVESLVRHAGRGSRRSHASASRLKTPLLWTLGVKSSRRWLAVALGDAAVVYYYLLYIHTADRYVT